MNREFSIRDRISSIRFAWQGIRMFFNSEHNARIHLVATLGVALMCCWCRPSGVELLALIIVTAMVWMAEIFNTAVETMADRISPARDPLIKRVKDLSAAAVLIAAANAVLCGLIIFCPKFFK